jgi:hypothetical protein
MISLRSRVVRAMIATTNWLCYDRQMTVAQVADHKLILAIVDLYGFVLAQEVNRSSR